MGATALLLAGLAACADDEGGGSSGEGPSWAVGIYFAADNNLDPFAIVDMSELASRTQPSNADVLVFLDRAPVGKYATVTANGVLDDGEATLYRLEGRRFEVVEALGEVDSGAVETLHDFAARVDAMKADHRALILWDHGASRGFGVDETSDRSGFGLDEIERALRTDIDAEPEAAEHFTFDILGVDACSMSSLPALARIGPMGRYYVASAEIEPGDGWDYAAMMRSIDRGAGPEELATEIVEAFGEFYADGSRTSGIRPTLAAWNTKGIDNLVAATEALQAAASTQTIEVQIRDGASSRARARGYAVSDDADPLDVDFGGYLLALTEGAESPDYGQAAATARAALLSARVAFWTADESAPADGLTVPFSATEETANPEDFSVFDPKARDELAMTDIDDPTVSVTQMGPVNMSGFVTLDIQAADDTLLEKLELGVVDVQPDGTWEVASVYRLDADGSPDFQILGGAPLDYILVAPSGRAATVEDRAALFYQDHLVYLLVEYAADAVTTPQVGQLLLSSGSLDPAGLALRENGRWSLEPWEDVVAHGGRIAPVRATMDPATGAWTTERVVDPFDTSELSTDFVAVMADRVRFTLRARDIAGRHGFVDVPYTP